MTYLVSPHTRLILGRAGWLVHDQCHADAFNAENCGGHTHRRCPIVPILPRYDLYSPLFPFYNWINSRFIWTFQSRHHQFCFSCGQISQAKNHYIHQELFRNIWNVKLTSFFLVLSNPCGSSWKVAWCTIQVPVCNWLLGWTHLLSKSTSLAPSPINFANHFLGSASIVWYWITLCDLATMIYLFM